MKPTTGKLSYKTYECMNCGKRTDHQTNHWGEIYARCTACGHTRLFCTEDPPEGYGIPEPWKMVKLGDICEIK